MNGFFPIVPVGSSVNWGSSSYKPALDSMKKAFKASFVVKRMASARPPSGEVALKEEYLLVSRLVFVVVSLFKLAIVDLAWMDVPKGS